MIIGLIGTIASGKGLVGKYLKNKGFQHITLSDFIREKLKEENKPFTRKNLQDMGNELRIKHGPGILALKALEKINKENAVIEGVRNLLEVEEIKKKNGFILGIDAPINLRWERYKKGSEEKIKSYEEFVEKDLRDRTEQFDYGLQIDKCLEKADFKIINNKSKKELYKNMGVILKKWKR